MIGTSVDSIRFGAAFLDPELPGEVQIKWYQAVCLLYCDLEFDWLSGLNYNHGNIELSQT